MISYSKLSSGEYFPGLLLKFAAQRLLCSKLVSWSARGKLLPEQCASICWGYEIIFLTTFLQYSPDLLNGYASFIYLGVLLILDEEIWDYLNECCLVAFWEWHLISIPLPQFFWGLCFLQRECTENFKLVLNVGFVCFFKEQEQYQPMKQSPSRPQAW